jgi:hypothetical protein
MSVDAMMLIAIPREQKLFSRETKNKIETEKLIRPCSQQSQHPQLCHTNRRWLHSTTILQ